MSGPTPGSPEWSRLVTASKAAAILGISPWESPYSAWMTMKGLAPAREQTTTMSRGNYLEPAILDWWVDQHPEFFDSDWTNCSQQWFPLDDWAGATTDLSVSPLAPPVEGKSGRTILPAKYIVEAKSAARMDEWGEPGTDTIPAYYLAQCYFQLAVTGAERCYVPVIGPYLEFSEYVVEADAEMQDQTLAACRRFYDSLSADEPPPLDDRPATYDVVRRMHPDIERGEVAPLTPEQAVEWLDAKAALDAAVDRERGARTVIAAAMGRSQYADCGTVRVARRQPGKGGSVQINKVAKSAASITRLEETA